MGCRCESEKGGRKIDNINVGRWFVSGLVAGVIIFIVDTVVNGMLLGDQWAQAMADLGKPAMNEGAGTIIAFLIVDLVIGLGALAIYVGFRPRFGGSPRAAVYAGLMTWLLAQAVPTAFMLIIGLFPSAFLWTGAIIGVVQIVAATLAGAYLYQETA